MGNKVHRSNNHHLVMKQVWSGIDKNPQYHANLFFISLCKKYPQYSKYFTTEQNVPLSVDARTSAKFRLIIEALGYLLLDSYKKQDQSDYITGYIAMVHKDMDLMRSDMFNFGESLIDYLAATFPRSMTPDCQNIVSGYIHNLLNEISQKMEALREDDVNATDFARQNEKRSVKERLRRRSDSIYGHPVEYWVERKHQWEERLDSWRRQAEGVNSEIEVPAPEEVPKEATKEVAIACVGSSADQFLKSYGVLEAIRQTV
ncbi:uncharacterized protein LOC135173085 [Diachasmimorpha longicaudata]|uniref:uncharacterized protein LOC135173085 n=1 Tax=Diachasmimorpha longicaudata TaxID=58733 RepID=UPI0030B8DA1B